MEILKKDFTLFDELADQGPEKIVLTDTSFIETVALLGLEN